MAQLPLEEAIVRFKGNEERIEQFVNDADGYTSSAGQPVESLPAFLSRVEQEVGTVADNLAAAQAAQSAAEAARDAARLSAGVYVSTAAGIAAVVDGAYFSVPSADSSEHLILYRRSGAAATEIKRYPSTAALAAIDPRRKLGKLTTPAVYSVEDASGNQVLRVLGDGSVELMRLDVMGKPLRVLRSDGSAVMEVGSTGSLLKLLTASGGVPFAVGDDGQISLQDIALQSITAEQADFGDLDAADGGLQIRKLTGPALRASGGINLAMVDSAGYIGWLPDSMVLPDPDAKEQGSYLTPAPVFMRRGPWEITHQIAYGQSNSVGGGADVPIDTLRFNVGRVTYGGDTYNATVQAQNHASFTAGAAQFPDSAISGFSYLLNLISIRDYKQDPKTDPVKFLNSAPGRAGVPIEFLMKASNNAYRHLIDDITYGKSLAAAQGKSYGVSNVVFIQGEGDSDGSFQATQTVAGYKAKMAQLFTDINADAKAITGQSQDVIFVTWQVNKCDSTPPVFPINHAVPQAQLELSEENPLVCLSVPAYIFDHTAGDIWHPTNEHRAWIGAYSALAYERFKSTGVKPKPLSPERIWRNGRFLMIQMHVPYMPLVLDQWRVGPTPNHGFELFAPDGSAIAISSVSVVHDTIKIATAADIPAGSTVRYAMQDFASTDTPRLTGQRGNLRDSQGAYIPKFLGIYEMHNPCVKFIRSIA